MSNFSRQNLNNLTSGSDKALEVVDKFVADNGGMDNIRATMDWGSDSEKCVSKLREAQDRVMGFKKKRITREEYAWLCTKVFTRDKWKCVVCKSRNNLQAHHIVFRSQGGTDTLENMKTLCCDCHSDVHGTGMN